MRKIIFLLALAPLFANAQIGLTNSFKMNVKKYLEYNQGKTNGIPFSSYGEALAAQTPSAFRKQGPVVWVTIGGELKEFWFKNGTADSNFVEKSMGGGGGTFDTSLLHLPERFASKQSLLVSGTNIRTINGNSLLGNTDLVISGGLSYPNTIKKYLNAYGSFSSFLSDSISEGATNQYYTNARARAAISVTGSGSYNGSTGVITLNGTDTSVVTTQARTAAGLATKLTIGYNRNNADKFYKKVRSGLPVTIACEGTSLTYGYNATASYPGLPGNADPRTRNPWPETMDSVLNANGISATVTNRGQGGDRTIEGLARWPSAPFTDVTFIEFAPNDANNYGGYPSGPVGLDTFKTNLSLMVERRLAQGSYVILCEDPDVNNTTLANTRIQLYKKVVREVAAYYNVPILNVWDIVNPLGQVWEDGVHLYDNAYLQWGIQAAYMIINNVKANQATYSLKDGGVMITSDGKNTLHLYDNSISPYVGNGGALTFDARGTGRTVSSYAQIEGYATDGTAGAENGRLYIKNKYNGSFVSSFVSMENGLAYMPNTLKVGTLGIRGGARLTVGRTATWDSQDNFAMALNTYSGAAGLLMGFDTTINAGAIAAVQYDNAWRNIVINPNGGNLGVGGTVSPTNPLTVTGTGSFSGQLGVGTTVPDGSSVLDLTSTTKGMLAPRMNTTQQNAIPTPATGLVIYNTDSLGLTFFNGTAWRLVGGNSSLSFNGLFSNYTAIPNVDSAAAAHGWVDANFWKLGGNAGITSVSNFIGTTDNKSLRFRTNNVERGSFDSATGVMKIGTAGNNYATIEGDTYPALLFYDASNVRTGGFTGDPATGDIYFDYKGTTGGHTFFRNNLDVVGLFDNYGNFKLGTGGSFTANSKLDVDGQVTIRGGNPGDGKVLVSDAVGKSSWVPASGDYTPTLTYTTNIGAATPYSLHYSISGKVVTVAGQFDIDITAPSVASELRFTLPIASAFVSSGDAGGFGGDDLVSTVGSFRAVPGTSLVAFKTASALVDNTSVSFSFTYKIL